VRSGALVEPFVMAITDYMALHAKARKAGKLRREEP
jgi:hypothetical protein